jgi:hypothetical protein
MERILDEQGRSDGVGIGATLAQIARDLREIVRLEVELVRTELRSELRGARVAVALLAVAGVVGLLGVAMLPVAAALALAAVVPPWAAFLGVGLVLAAVAAGLGFAGVKRLRTVDPVPHRAIETLTDPSGTRGSADATA